MLQLKVAERCGQVRWDLPCSLPSLMLISFGEREDPCQFCLRVLQDSFLSCAALPSPTPNPQFVSILNHLFFNLRTFFSVQKSWLCFMSISPLTSQTPISSLVFLQHLRFERKGSSNHRTQLTI